MPSREKHERLKLHYQNRRAAEEARRFRARESAFSRWDADYRRTLADAARLLAKPADMALAFAELLDGVSAFVSSAEFTNETETIARGVAEAIAIKADSLRQSAEGAREASEKTLEGVSPITSPDGRSAKLIREKRAAERARVLAAAEKSRAAFLKDALLFEVSTFDEMMYYSVPRLAQSGDPAARKLAGLCAGTSLGIERLLAEAGIFPVEPQPGEMFSGRWHVALAAEPHPERKRGEIIAVCGRGWREGDKALVRANVIAAR
ncbi:MAG: hypothetical protein LBK41_07180 [Clostridiales bacterium]|jgi:hypothetical protein|nr:hypothetical protein [Clostridiales bacterium]